MIRAFFGVFSLLASGCTGVIASTGPDSSGVAGGTAGPTAGLASGGTSAPADAASLPLEPAPAVLARLTTAQYRNAIRDLFGRDLAKVELQLDTRPYNFSVIGASTSSVSEHGVALYGVSAQDVASKVFADQTLRATLLSCAGEGAVDVTCLTQFVEQFGRRAFRRPLEPAEIQSYVALGLEIAATGAGLGPQYVVAAMLQSPSFLYRVEVGEPAPEHPGWSRYTAYEIASRLSFLLRNSIPDAELLQAAADGTLAGPEGVRAQAERLLTDTAPTKAMVDQLFREYLDIPLLEKVEFPVELGDSAALSTAMGQEVSAFVSRIALEEPTDMRTLFTTTRTSVDPQLASFYGVLAPAPGTWANVALPADGPRAGLLTTGAMLTIHNRPHRTSPTMRGLFIRQRLLCGTIPPPPDNIPPLNETDTGTPTTVRDKLLEHAINPACSACHRAMDPLGLGLEEFDQFGRFRGAYDNGLPIDNSGDLDGTAFNGAKQLGELLAKDERVTACLVTQMYRYASSRLDDEGEAGELARMHESFKAGGYQFQSLLLALVQSESFRYFKPEAP